MRLIIAIILLLTTSIATAETIRIGSRIITTGMSTADVIDRAGQPSRTIPLENVYGAGVGERWEYYQGRKQYNIWLQSGRVVRVEEL